MKKFLNVSLFHLAPAIWNSSSNSPTLDGQVAKACLPSLKKMGKKAVSMVILFLVVATIVLCVLSLYYMLTEERKIDKTFQSSDFIDKAYFNRIQLDYILEGIFEGVIEEGCYSQGKDVFIGCFRKELENYKLEDGSYLVEGLNSVEGQLVEDNIVLTEEKLVLSLDLNVKAQDVEDYRFVKVDYDYEIQLEKVFK